MKSIPVLHVQARTLAQAYDAALQELHTHGTRFGTQYDKPGDPLSIDATMNITIEEPLADPMIHKAFPGGFANLREYVYELEGRKDSWVKNMDDDADMRWEYTYHGRLANYGQWKERGEWVGEFAVDQVQNTIDKLSAQPSTRQAQMITWMPNLDLKIYDPPCLQSIWFRILEDEDGVWWLNSNVRFRSNDAWGAFFMNAFGFIQFFKDVIAAGIAEKTGKDVQLGRVNWHADSWHIYGSDLAEAEGRFFGRLETTTFAERTYNFHDEFIQQMYLEEEAGILAKIDEYTKKYEVQEEK